MAGKTRMGPKTVSRTRAEAFLAFARNDGSSDAMIASALGISRQRISILHAAYRKAVGNPSTPPETETVQLEQSAAGSGNAPQPAPAVVATVRLERQQLRELAGEDGQLEVLVDKILRGSAPRAAAIAVGITAKQFTKRIESDDRFRDLVLRAAHEAESSVAQNLYRLATSNSPQAVQSAIAWLNARVPDD